MRTIGTLLLLLGPLVAVGWSDPPAGRNAVPAAQSNSAGPKTAPAKGQDKMGGAAAKKRRPKFTIGKETTYVPGPRDADGYIDYAAALNERLRQGVTPANNANVLLWKALGPRPEGARMSAEFYQWLGIDEPPPRGDYFLRMGDYLKEQIKSGPPAGGETVFDELERSLRRPWKAVRYPHIADWLKANDKPLTVVIEAVQRSHYYLPLVPTRTDKGSAGLVSCLLPSVQKCRELATALTARACCASARDASTTPGAT